MTDNVQAFHLLVTSRMWKQAFEQLWHIFCEKFTIDSEYTIFHWMGVLLGVKPIIHDCCPNSCITYTTKYIHYQSCPFCKEPHYESGNPHWSFVYFPLIPQLQGYFQSKEMIEKMVYQSDYEGTPGEISDVFNGSHYQNLLQKQVVVVGEKLHHCYFSDPHDIALSLCTNSYLLFKWNHKGPSATPILLQNYNLPPQIWTHHENLICVGIILGPKQPKDPGSFLALLDDEAAKLAYGVRTFEAKKETMFNMHAYFVFKLGDMIVIEKFLSIKGYNKIYPCLSCKIWGVCGIAKMYYVPFCPSKNPQDHRADSVMWDPTALPSQQHKDFIHIVSRIQAARTRLKRKRSRRRLASRVSL